MSVLSRCIVSALYTGTAEPRLAFWLEMQRDFFCCIVSHYNNGTLR